MKALASCYLAAGKPVVDLEHGKLPDPVAEVIRIVIGEQEKLGDRLRKLESLSGIVTPEDRFEERVRDIVKGFSQGGGI